MLKSALFDLDDTLVHCSKYYRNAHEEGGKYISDLTNGAIGPEEVIQVIAEIDLDKARAEPQFRKERFAESFQEALMTLAPSFNHDTLQEAARIGNSVYTAEYALRRGAKELLDATKELGFKNILVTKGDPSIQNYKIDKNGLRAYFDSINIVQVKNTATWGKVILLESVLLSGSFIVGDSLKDDIAPCQSLGIGNTVHISTENPWAYNAAAVKPSYSVNCLTEVVELLTQRVKPC